MMIAMNYKHDAIGRLLQITDPNGVVTAMTYHPRGWLLSRTDVLNRLATQAVTNGPSFTYSYDQGAFGLGRLSGISEGSAGGTQYSYDALGRVTAKSETLHGRTLTMGYGYAPGGKLNRSTYPSGRVLSYGFDAAGRIESLTLDGSTVLLSQAGWQPFGPPNGWVWGNGAIHQS